MREKYKIPADYYIIFCICALLIVLALIFDAPDQMLINYYRINTSRSVLVTDYVALAGLGAALVNSAISGIFYLILLVFNRCKPNGKIIASLFVTMGFSLFGKNMFNTLPILAGVWLYARFRRHQFSDLLAQAMLAATIAPLVSEIAFLDECVSWTKIIAAYGVGVFVGFIFPVLAESVKKMHGGYCLYNSGIAGGFIATFFVGILRSVGIDVLPESFWDTSHTLLLAAFAYTVAAMLIAYGIATDKPVNAYNKFKQLLNEKDLDEHDYLTKYGVTCYVNIGIMCIVSTSVVLLLGIPVNGPVLGGIFTVSGFSASGKHLRSVAPILLGSIAATYLNHLEVADPANALAILFSTGLAPVSGKHGWQWGIAVGFLHVSVAVFIGHLNGGLNLYNNGFAESFVAITVVPLILFFRERFPRSPKAP